MGITWVPPLDVKQWIYFCKEEILSVNFQLTVAVVKQKDDSIVLSLLYYVVWLYHRALYRNIKI